jgi:hypothetical protein
MMRIDMNLSLLLRLALGAALALLLAPSIGRASCGDYLTHGDKATAMPQHDSPPVAPKPCNGPNCRQSPPAIPIAPATPVVIGAEDWACGAFDHAVAVDSSSRHDLDGAAGMPVRRTSDIFHPPRQISA